MFIYVKNKFNPEPDYIDEFDLNNDLKNKYFLIKFSKAPYLELPKTKDELKKTYKKKFLYNIRWGRKKYEEKFGKLFFDIKYNDKEIEYFMEQVFKIFNERWKSEYTSSKWKKEIYFKDYVNAMIELSKKDKAFLAVLYNEKKELLSYGYCLKEMDKIYLYQHTTKRIANLKGVSLGKLLIYELILFGIENKYKILDFMVGTSQYKYEWTKKERWIFRKFDKNLKGYFYSKFYDLKYKIQFNPLFRPYLKKILKVLNNV